MERLRAMQNSRKLVELKATGKTSVCIRGVCHVGAERGGWRSRSEAGTLRSEGWFEARQGGTVEKNRLGGKADLDAASDGQVAA